MRALLRVFGFAMAVGTATSLLGWWTVPVLAALAARAASRRRAPALTCALGAALGWALVLGWVWLNGPVLAVARRTGGSLGIGAWGFTLATLLFPSLLAAAAAQVATRARDR